MVGRHTRDLPAGVRKLCFASGVTLSALTGRVNITSVRPTDVGVVTTSRGGL